jgi:hypothetical protein
MGRNISSQEQGMDTLYVAQSNVLDNERSSCLLKLSLSDLWVHDSIVLGAGLRKSVRAMYTSWMLLERRTSVKGHWLAPSIHWKFFEWRRCLKPLLFGRIVP